MRKNFVAGPSRMNWYLGLTHDFRDWKILGTTIDPNKAFAERYVWFYGPFKSKEAAELFKKAEWKSNPGRKFKNGDTVTPQQGEYDPYIIISVRGKYTYMKSLKFKKGMAQIQTSDLNRAWKLVRGS